MTRVFFHLEGAQCVRGTTKSCPLKAPRQEASACWGRNHLQGSARCKGVSHSRKGLAPSRPFPTRADGHLLYTKGSAVKLRGPRPSALIPATLEPARSFPSGLALLWPERSRVGLIRSCTWPGLHLSTALLLVRGEWVVPEWWSECPKVTRLQVAGQTCYP